MLFRRWLSVDFVPFTLVLFLFLRASVLPARLSAVQQRYAEIAAAAAASADDVRPPPGPPPNDDLGDLAFTDPFSIRPPSHGPSDEDTDSDDDIGGRVTSAELAAMAERLEQVQRESQAQFESMRDSHSKEVGRVHRTLEERYQQELKTKLDTQRTELEVAAQQKLRASALKLRAEYEEQLRVEREGREQASRLA